MPLAGLGIRKTADEGLRGGCSPVRGGGGDYTGPDSWRLWGLWSRESSPHLPRSGVESPDCCLGCHFQLPRGRLGRIEVSVEGLIPPSGHNLFSGILSWK